MTEVIKEYAEALFLIAAEQNKEEEFLQKLNEFSEICEETPEFIMFLTSPNISVKERTEFISEVFEKDFPEVIVSLLQMLTERGYIKHYLMCINEYKKLFDDKNSVSVADVISAVPLSKEQKQILAEKLQKRCGHEVQLNCTEDESILGGVIVHLDEMVIDGSLCHKLNAAKDVMIK